MQWALECYLRQAVFRLFGRPGSGQEITDGAPVRLRMERSFSLRAKLEVLQTQNGEAVLLPHQCPVNDHIEREQSLESKRPCNAQLQLRSARQFLIALETDHFVAEISRAARSVISALAAPVRKLKLKVQLVPWP